MLIQIKALKMLKDVVIEGDKVVLYGPNGSGKSTVIHFLLLALTKLSAGQYYNSDVLPGPVLEKAEAVVQFRKFRVEPLDRARAVVSFGTFQVDIDGYNLSARRDDGSRWSSTVTSPDGWGQDLVVWHVDEVKARQVGAVRECGTVFGGEEAHFVGDLELFVVRCPKVARRFYLEVYYDRSYDPDLGWIPIRRLSYGQRRRLAIEAALVTGDFVAVENFEAGLHVDYIAELIKQIAESDAAVVLETHSGLVLRLAMRYGLHAYYIEQGARRIERLDDVGLFQRELSAYQAVVPHGGS
ncbi:MAG: AAA family ATPase [Pyrobaculum sp.]|nr:AAA family ATPase [Pyrobaculum sp.]